MIKKHTLESLVNDKSIFIILFFYTFLLLFFCSKMSPLYPFNDWSDINLYFNIGKSIFNGKVLYTEVFDHKGPLIFFIYGFGYLLSNDSFIGMYVIQAIVWLIMVYAVYFTSRMFLDKVYSFIVALAFPVILLSHSLDGGSAEEFITAFIVISLFYFITYFKEKNIAIHKPSYMFIHGLMCSMALLIKLNLVVFWIFPLLAVFINILLSKEYRNLWLNILAFIGGMLVITIPICIYLFINDALTESYNIYILLNKSYAKMSSMSDTFGYLTIRFYQRLRFDPIEFTIILIGAIYFPIRYIKNRIGQIGLILSFWCLYTVIFMSPNYVYYYSIPYYVYAIFGFIVIADYLSKYITIRYAWHIAIIFAFVALCGGISRKNYFEYSTDVLLRRGEDESLRNQFGKIIEKEKDSTLLNLGLDSGNGLFTKLNIFPKHKYFISPNLPYEIYPQMRDEQTRYIENREIEFIILADYSFNFEYFRSLPALNDNYTVVDTYLEDDFKTYYLYKRND
ncbi:glycosyltransferase family 39 protein [Dysgonomonas sp. ZJ709]|uniref:ArnT family glycosyltransferase n=1 Tax=Dysgonomonas sp. ZJ709 TaxID=2709797 RepID=UPI0013E9E3B1|nr:glycosyltransferase family 39 protein [Dysgonomonas sp. ZJ709]